MADSPNVVFVTVDCLREDFVSGEWADTPFLDHLVERGSEYQNLHATTTTTAPSVASIFTGMYSEKNGVNSLREADLKDSVSTMPALFSKAGYESTGLLLQPLAEEIGFHRGFDDYHYRRNDEYLVGDWYETAIDKVESLSEPFFLYVHLWELHVPGPEDSLPPEFNDPEYGDNAYARMLSALDRRLDGLFDAVPEDTVKAVHADHGESVSWRGSTLRTVCKRLRDRLRYEHGYDTRTAERVLNRLFDPLSPSYDDHFLESGHGETIYDFMTNVPFIVDGPGVHSATVTEQCRQVDVLPTLLDIVSIDIPDDVDGESLYPPGRVTHRPAYLRACGANLCGEKNWQQGVRTPEHKYITYSNRDWGDELYDLTADPRELKNVASAQENVVSDIADQLPDRELMDVDRAGIDDHLRDLGYL